jgi:hypothetical protein
MIFSRICLISLALTLGGCAGVNVDTQYNKQEIGFGRLTQSHFTYPNSNVIPLGQATGKSHKTGSLSDFPSMSEGLTEAMDQAIRSKPGADMLVNATTSGVLTTTTVRRQSTRDGRPDSAPDLNIIYDLDVTVTGTAVKMEIGKQILK